METSYCIYSNKYVDYIKTNIEHVIPLALGGSDKFCIRVDKDINSILGTKIDAKIANDYFISSVRRHKDFRGHSGKIPETKLINTRLKETNKPVQLIFKGKSSHFYDPIEKRILSEEESKGLAFTSTIKFEKNIRMLFTAKVLLSAGYFIYGQTFIDYADHNSLRKLMNYTLTETDETIKDLPVGIIDSLHEIEEKDKGFVRVFEMICNAVDSSCVIFNVRNGNIIGSVGIGGQYIGTINFKADTEHFPSEGKYKLGHVIGIQNKKLKRSSLLHMTELIKTNIEKRKPPIR